MRRRKARATTGYVRLSKHFNGHDAQPASRHRLNLKKFNHNESDNSQLAIWL